MKRTKRTWLAYLWHYYLWPALALTDPDSPRGLKLRAEKLEEDEERERQPR